MCLAYSYLFSMKYQVFLKKTMLVIIESGKHLSLKNLYFFSRKEIMIDRLKAKPKCDFDSNRCPQINSCNFFSYNFVEYKIV